MRLLRQAAWWSLSVCCSRAWTKPLLCKWCLCECIRKFTWNCLSSPSDSVERARWQAEMVSIEVRVQWRNAHPRPCRLSLFGWGENLSPSYPINMIVNILDSLCALCTINWLSQLAGKKAKNSLWAWWPVFFFFFFFSAKPSFITCFLFLFFLLFFFFTRLENQHSVWLRHTLDD